jgi:hypothetical protein
VTTPSPVTSTGPTNPGDFLKNGCERSCVNQLSQTKPSMVFSRSEKFLHSLGGYM